MENVLFQIYVLQVKVLFYIKKYSIVKVKNNYKVADGSIDPK